MGKSCIVEKEKNDKKQVKNILEEFMRLRNIYCGAGCDHGAYDCPCSIPAQSEYFPPSERNRE